MKKIIQKRTESESVASNKIDVVGLLNQMDFSPDNVVDAAAVNPVLFVRAIKYRLQCLEEKVRLERSLKRLSAETELAIRSEAKSNDDKITENHIRAKLLLDEDVSEAIKLSEEAEVYDEYSKLVVEGFRMRRDCLKIVSDMTRDEMRVGRALDDASETISNNRKKLEERFPGKS